MKQGTGKLKNLKEQFVLIWKLAKNDFVTKYSGNYFGVFWAFVQPMVTIFIYIFVFQVGFKARDAQNGYPYALWLIAGIVPWFFFGEGLMGATNAFAEYSYLVKKVVFRIDILPLVKIFSSLFIHVFFVMFALLIFFLYGMIPDLRFLQILYYGICLICLITACSYLTSSIVPFFKDFGQIISVLIQIGMWLTPIMWNFDELAPTLGKWGVLFKINPMFYIVQGYRDSFMRGGVFWNRGMTIYFWAVVLIIGFIGCFCFRKMKPHFADVL